MCLLNCGLKSDKVIEINGECGASCNNVACLNSALCSTGTAALEELALEANAKICQMAEKETAKALGVILQKASELMRNGFKLSDN